MKLTTEQQNELTNLLSLTWTRNNGQPDPKMIEHCLTNIKYVKIDDMFVGVCASKPSITKTIWYDDEREDPGAGWITFKNLNYRHNMPNMFESRRRSEELYFHSAYWNDKTNGKLVGVTYDEEPFRVSVIRKVTLEELAIINEAITEVQIDYAKRLVNYFKRYSNHVRSEGYWVNR